MAENKFWTEGVSRGIPSDLIPMYVQRRTNGLSANLAEMLTLREGPAGTVKGSSTPCQKRSHR